MTGIFTGLLIYTDISIHDSYIKNIISYCHPDQQDGWCTLIRSVLDKPPTAQLELGEAYWAVLLIQAVTISFVMFLLRIFVNRLAGEPLSPMVFLIALLWGFTTFSFYYFGWIDFGYYVLRGLEIPEEGMVAYPPAV